MEVEIKEESTKKHKAHKQATEIKDKGITENTKQKIKNEGKEKVKKTEKKEREVWGEADKEEEEDKIGEVGCNRNNGEKNKEINGWYPPSSHRKI